MGLGKRCRPLAHIRLKKTRAACTTPALIIAPVSLMGKTGSATAVMATCAAWCCAARGLHAAADAVAEHDVVIAPYSLLQRDRARWLAPSGIWWCWTKPEHQECQHPRRAHW